MKKHTVAEISEEIAGLKLAWPDAPQELWDSLREELAEAVARECENRPRPPKRSIRGNHGTAPHRS